MKNSLRNILFCALLLVPVFSMGQSGVYVSQVGKPVPLPGSVTCVADVNGAIYCYSLGLQQRVCQSGGELVYAAPDTMHVVPDPSADYVVRHPVSGNMFFTVRSGRSHKLYEVIDKDGLISVRQVKIGGKSLPVECPSFSADGRFMVFSMVGKIGFGGTDLYYSEWRDGKWQQALNLGRVVNTEGDECSPVIWNDFLLYATNGRKDGCGGFDFYASRLVLDSLKSKSDAVKLTVGTPQHLPEPLNSSANESRLLVAGDRVYVSSNRDSSAIGDVLCAYNCQLDGYKVIGTVSNMIGQVQPRAMITVKQKGRKLLSSQTDGQGRYEIYLKKDESYDIEFSKVGFGYDVLHLNTHRNDEQQLVFSSTYDIALPCFEPGQHMELENLFGTEASVEITEYGHARLEPIINFLQVNPHSPVSMTIYSNLNSEGNLNRMLSAQRLITLRDYFFGQVPEADRITFENGVEQDAGNPKKRSGNLLVVNFGNY